MIERIVPPSTFFREASVIVRQLTLPLLLLLLPAGAVAQTRSVDVITLEAAGRMVAAAETEARANGWAVTIAIVDPAGDLVLLHRLDGASLGSVEISQAKARTAARFKRPTKALEEAVAGGRIVVMALPGVTPVEGGLPIALGDRVVGAIGVSGASSAQDAQVAAAGIRALGQ
jgi:glc operon protein GlcG